MSRCVEMCENCNRTIGVDETQHGCPCGCKQTVCRRCYRCVKQRVAAGAVRTMREEEIGG